MTCKHELIAEGRKLADRDFEKLRKRVYAATTAEIFSKWWTLKHLSYAFLLGFLAPPLWSAKGRAYHNRMNQRRNIERVD